MRPKLLAALAAFVVVITGLGAAMHGHMPAADGWHAAPGESSSAASHDEGFSSCSICRLAHETSPIPVTPGVVSAPLALTTPRTLDRCAIAHASPIAKHSPRAPPCLASC